MPALDMTFAALADRPGAASSRAPDARRNTRRRSRVAVRHVAQRGFEASQGAREGGLVRRTRVGREHYMQLRAAPLKEVARWTSQYERFWNQRLDALGEFLNTQNQKEHNDG